MASSAAEMASSNPTPLPRPPPPPRTGLRLYNSFSRSVEDFTPRDPKGVRVTWYSCGPTVYDASHMGHARSYITFDILRRVLAQYFGYDIFFVMNITDVDDKIIKRARQEFLFKEYCLKPQTITEISDELTQALDHYVIGTLTEADPDKKTMREKSLTKIHAVMSAVAEEIKKAPRDEEKVAEQKEILLQGSRDILYDWLDNKLRLNNAEGRVFDNEIFNQFSRRWEEEYFKDMEALNILPPDVLTRVSEYVPEIVEYIEKIIGNGYAYESNGSVYFDVLKYKQSPGHKYAKLVPEAVGDEKMLMEGEGELTTAKSSGEKRSPADFALWKASRLGEPSWDSPWGKGRPGWHIECSAMASAIVGKELDIHTGGVDLKFPHHDNEIAQSEAYFDCDDWVKYFLHSGHLTIAGCKMSKSLKNFITIKDALNEYTPSQLRLTFLLHSWKDTLDYSPSGMGTAIQMEQKIQEFFLNVKDCLRSASSGDPYPKWTKEDLTLQKNIDEAKAGVHAALCDSIDTRSAIFSLRDLISASNIYIQNAKNNKQPLNAPLLKAGAKYVTLILRIFGVITSTELDSFGFKSASSGGDGNTTSMDVEEIILPFVEVLSEFREQIRATAKSIVEPGIKSGILKACDAIRDEKLPNLGVRLEDHEGCPTVLKYVGKEAMQKEKEQREKLKAAEAAEKQRKKDEMAKAAAEKEAQKKIPPTQLFLKDTDKYSKFNEQGIPTHDLEGNPIAKSQLKKLEKVYAQQKKMYEDYMKTSGQAS